LFLPIDFDKQQLFVQQQHQQQQQQQKEEKTCCLKEHRRRNLAWRKKTLSKVNNLFVISIMFRIVDSNSHIVILTEAVIFV